VHFIPLGRLLLITQVLTIKHKRIVGCMIIVHDLLTDQKINLVHHSNEIVALAFSPPGVGSAPSTTGAGGEFLISIDLNRNEMSELNNHSHSKMCLWNWQKG
jgi:hypothetical protein